MWYIANEGDCFRSIEGGFVLKYVVERGTHYNICIKAGVKQWTLGERKLYDMDQARKFHKQHFERYYDFNDYLNQIEDDTQGI